MEAKIKAQQLVDKFKPLVTTWDCYNDTPLDGDLILKDAKQCALICVDEILATSASEYEHEDNFWRAVKEAITLIAI